MQNIYWPTFNFLVFFQGQRQEPLNISNLKKMITKTKRYHALNVAIFLTLNLIFMSRSFSVILGHFCLWIWSSWPNIFQYFMDFFASNWIFMSKSFWVILGQSLTKHGRSLTWSAWDLFPHVRFSFGSEREPRPHSRDLTAFWKSY